MFGNLFKQQSHYVFDYKPRYYDERKERFKKLENANSDDTHITFTKNNLKSKWVRAKKPAADRSANRRVLLIVLILVLLTALYFKSHLFLS